MSRCAHLICGGLCMGGGFKDCYITSMYKVLSRTIKLYNQHTTQVFHFFFSYGVTMSWCNHDTSFSFIRQTVEETRHYDAATLCRVSLKPLKKLPLYHFVWILSEFLLTFW